jgi:AMMECR1 domain-containing protein
MNGDASGPSPEGCAWLLRHARAALARSVGAKVDEPGPAPADPALGAPARLFVSWHDGPALVGCIGTLSPWPRLDSAVARYAVAAGDDARTPALDPGRVPALHCEISILGEARQVEAIGFDAIVAAVTEGRPGVCLTGPGGKSAFFLPTVWEKLPDASDFLTALARKGGIDLARDRESLRAELSAARVFSS